MIVNILKYIIIVSMEDNKQLIDSLHLIDLRFFDSKTYLIEKTFFILNSVNKNEMLRFILKDYHQISGDHEQIINLIHKHYVIDILLYENIIETQLEKNIVLTSSDIISSAIEKAIEIFNEKSHKNIILSSRIVINFPLDDISHIYRLMTLQQAYSISHPDIQIILMFKHSIVCKLFKGLNIIYLSNTIFTKKGVGLLPIKCSNISTEGLKWDVGMIILIKQIGIAIWEN